MRVELPAGCTGLDAPNGAILRPKKGSRAVEIRNRQFGRLAQAALGKTSDATAGFADSDIPSAICSSCGFHRFAFTDRPPACPRCGHTDSPGIKEET